MGTDHYYSSKYFHFLAVKRLALLFMMAYLSFAIPYFS